MYICVLYSPMGGEKKKTLGLSLSVSILHTGLAERLLILISYY